VFVPGYKQLRRGACELFHAQRDQEPFW